MLEMIIKQITDEMKKINELLEECEKQEIEANKNLKTVQEIKNNLNIKKERLTKTLELLKEEKNEQ